MVIGLGARLGLWKWLGLEIKGDFKVGGRIGFL